MISTEVICAELARHNEFISTVELAMMLEASSQEVRSALVKLGDRVTRNEHDEWRVTGNKVCLLSRSPLSASEIELKNQLENTVSQAFFVAGKALKELRDKRLYRETHATFESYVQDKFGYKKSAAYYLINASVVVDNLKSPQFVDKISSVEVLPTSESQCRPLAKLAPERQQACWTTAVERAGGKVPSARIIRQVVKEIQGEKLVSESKAKYITEEAEETEEIVMTSNMPAEYMIRADRETYEELEEYRLKVGAATKLGAIKRLLEIAKAKS